MKNIVIVASLFLLLLQQVNSSEVIVKLNSGKIRGVITRSLPYGLHARQFLGIPYAEAPLGELRFSPPVPIKPWSGIRDANEFPALCPQPPMPWPFPPAAKTSEDCLFLNVFTPLNSKGKLAVLVYIHGGGFHTGGAAEDLSLLSSLNDVIVVAVQYRLGALGFFNVPGSTTKGNYGLMDQVESLKWVQMNIAAFGGDLSKVIILGQSAGGVSVAMQLLIPQTKNLFRGAIAQSGAADSVQTCYKVQSKKPAEFFLGLLNCTLEGPFLDCIRSRSYEEIIAAQLKLMEPQNSQNLFVTVSPVVDGTYLVDLPRNLLSRQEFHKVPTIFGITSDEGSMLTDMFMKDMPLSMYTEEFFRGFVYSARDLAIGDNNLVKEAILFEYTNHGVRQSPETVRKQLATMWGDKFAIAPVVLNLEAFATAGIPGYFYIFSHRSKYSVFPPWVGVNHADDLPYTLGAALKDFPSLPLTTGFTDVEKGLNKFVMKLWTNFAKYGDPNYQEDGHDLVTWPKYTNENRTYLQIDLEWKTGKNFRMKESAFWNHFLPKLVSTNKQVKDDNNKKPKIEL